MKNFVFKTSLKWKEGKQGTVYNSEKPSIEVSTPPEFRGPEGYWSPEDLFLASISSCIMTTFLYFAQKESLVFLSYESETEGEVSFIEGKLTFSSVIVRPVIEVESESDRQTAKQLIEKSGNSCLISSSVKSKITVSPQIKVKTD